jgi:hypothetical protein
MADHRVQAVNRVLPWTWRLTHRRTVESNNAPATRRERSERALFILGHARSGTTVLQNALNDAREFFLFGEANLHLDPGTPDFRERYNRLQRGFGNQENKSSFCPKLFAEDSSWDAYLSALMDYYRYVGAKIVINPDGAEAACDRFFDFSTEHFYCAHYVFTFRNPVDVTCSTQGMSIFQGMQPEDAVKILHSYLSVMRLYIRMLRNLPNVHVVFQEAMTPDIFVSLGAQLGVDLSGTFHYYSGEKVRTYTPKDVIGDIAEPLGQVIALYDEFRRDALAGFDLAQIEQNAAAIDPTHPTALGRLYRGVQAQMDALAVVIGDTAPV